ncbi:unnamed protein product, partial [Closterium sp. Naga37s-1]
PSAEVQPLPLRFLALNSHAFISSDCTFQQLVASSRHSFPLQCLLPSLAVDRLLALNCHLAAAACHLLSPRPSFASLQCSPVRRLHWSASPAASTQHISPTP